VPGPVDKPYPTSRVAASARWPFFCDYQVPILAALVGRFIRRSSPVATVDSARRPLPQIACTTILHDDRRVLSGGSPQASEGIHTRLSPGRGRGYWTGAERVLEVRPALDTGATESAYSPNFQRKPRKRTSPTELLLIGLLRS
jgi:hypothetical protein